MKRTYNVNDIIDVDGEKHIVMTVFGSEIETMPLRKWVEKYRIININGEYMSIEEFIDREVYTILEEKGMSIEIKVGDKVFYK